MRSRPETVLNSPSIGLLHKTMAHKSVERDVGVNWHQRLDTPEAVGWIRQVEVEDVSVGISDGLVTKGGTVRTSGLGSCVAISLIDTRQAIGGMVHPMLPDATSQPVEEPGRFVATAVPDLISAVTTAGADHEALEASIVGGAEMLEFTASENSIGDRNVATARSLLKSADIPIIEEATGGSAGRSVRCDVTDGTVTIRTASTSE